MPTHLWLFGFLHDISSQSSFLHMGLIISIFGCKGTAFISFLQSPFWSFCGHKKNVHVMR